VRVVSIFLHGLWIAKYRLQTMLGVRRWYCGTLVARTGGGREAGRRKVCLDMIILAIDTGTWVSYKAGTAIKKDRD